MAKPELGTKRVCPTTGRKFYDLNKDPVVSPYTGQAFPRSAFEPQGRQLSAAPGGDDEEDEVVADTAAVEIVSLEEADETDDAKEVVVADDVEIEDDLDDAADDTFLETEEEGDDDVSDLIDGDIEDDEEV